MGNKINKNKEKEFFSEQLLNQLILNNDYYNKINKEDYEKEKKDLNKEKSLNKLYYKKELNLSINKNLKITFNVFDKALGNRIGIILLFNKDRKNCLVQVKVLFEFLYDNLVEKYLQCIKKFCYIYLLDSIEENELFQSFIVFSEKNVNKIKYPLILFIQKDNEKQQINESCIKLVIDDINDHEYFKDILLSFLQKKIELEKRIQIINNENILEKEKEINENLIYNE